MTADQKELSPSGNNHLPDLASFSIAILEHYVVSLIGSDAVAKLKEPYKKNVYFLSLANALSLAEKAFVENSKDRDICDLILALPLRKDNDLLAALKQFSSNPASPFLQELIAKKISQLFPRLDKTRVESAADEYVLYLRKELVSVPEVREILSAWAAIETSSAIKNVESYSLQTVELLKLIASNTSTSSNFATPNNNINDNLSASEENQERRPDEGFYLVRDQDRILLDGLETIGNTYTIKGPRKTGKTLLLKNVLKKVKRESIYIDLALINDRIISQGNPFYIVFCELIAEQIGLGVSLRDNYKESISITQQVTKYIEVHVLQKIQAPIILAIDNADRLIGTDLSMDFFPMLRHWHNDRYKHRGWEKVDLIIVVSSDPKLMIEATESPFNIATVIEVADFSYDELLALNTLYRDEFSSAGLKKIIQLTRGHPHLTRLAIEAVKNGDTSEENLFTAPLAENSPFRPYLRELSLVLAANSTLMLALRQISKHVYPSAESIAKLQSAGIIRVEQSQIYFTNDLIRLFFEAKL